MKENDSREMFEAKTLVEDAPVIICDNFRTPENIGSVIRLAANVGSKRVVCLGSGEYKLNKIRRTACMAIDYVELIQVGTSDFFAHIDLYVPEGYVFTAIETSAKAANIFTTPMPRKCAMVLGSEVHGVSKEILDMCDVQLYIPMTGPSTSMNVATAASVALFEWQRQTLFT